MKKFLVTLVVLFSVACAGKKYLTCVECLTQPQDKILGCLQSCTVVATPTTVATPTLTPTTTPTSTPTVSGTESSSTATPEVRPTATSTTIPPLGGVAKFYELGGCHWGDPHSVDPNTRICGFTARYTCKNCTVHQAWPCDKDHAHWEGSNSEFGTCSADMNQESTKNCVSCRARAWDITCASVGNSFIKVLSGNLTLSKGSCGNCYCGKLVGTGTYKVHVPAGAKVCINPDDYNDPITYAVPGGCPHGEIPILDHDWDGPTYTVATP